VEDWLYPAVIRCCTCTHSSRLYVHNNYCNNGWPAVLGLSSGRLSLPSLHCTRSSGLVTRPLSLAARQVRPLIRPWNGVSATVVCNAISSLAVLTIKSSSCLALPYSRSITASLSRSATMTSEWQGGLCKKSHHSRSRLLAVISIESAKAYCRMTTSIGLFNTDPVSIIASWRKNAAYSDNRLH